MSQSAAEALSRIRPAGPADLPAMQSILAAGLRNGGPRYYAHPGDVAWWVWHGDPRQSDQISYWMAGDAAFLVLDSTPPGEILVFTMPGLPVLPFVEWAREQVDHGAEVTWLADDDVETIDALAGADIHPVFSYRRYEWDLTTGPIPDPTLPEGWSLRTVESEAEADSRREAAHAAFQSTMDDEMHLERYLRFMRSPVYERERDLVAVSPSGRIGAFMIWWPDSSGIAQIEPFGTHPDFHRLGVGRALIYHGLARMADSGMRLARVCTELERRPATDFYLGVGFRDVGGLS